MVKEEKKVEEEKAEKKAQLNISDLDEDEFEDFPADEIPVEAEKKKEGFENTVELDATWEDDVVEEDFSNRLKKENDATTGVAPMKE
ncbi:hypothetical protein HDU92_002154 [Lobulomyces angularis]|nr:hypothetical protein HDU92_002154 [Lobulomyces angularis]